MSTIKRTVLISQPTLLAGASYITRFANTPPTPKLTPTGRCLYCDEPLIPEDDITVSKQLWCGTACRDEWEFNNA